MITLRAGVRLKSSVDTTEVLVVRAPAAPAVVRCGGEPIYAVADSSPSEPTDNCRRAGRGEERLRIGDVVVRLVSPKRPRSRALA